MASRPVDLDALLKNIVRRVQVRSAAAVLDVGATIDELLAAPGATEESVFRALASATSPIAKKAAAKTLGAMRTTVSAGVGRELDGVQRELFNGAGLGGAGWTWVAVIDDRTCDVGLGPGGCSQRHGQTYTEQQLADIGEPGAGGTICGVNCRCAIVPDAAAKPDGELRPELQEPIVRPRRRKT